MEDSQPDSNIFSVRIVSIDYYMSPPIPDMDICYSSFQGGTVNEVPVIRIYGSTPGGQKTCSHIHRALPYLYVPCADILLQPQQEVGAYIHAISLAIEKALKLKGNTASKRQHVHGCSLVRAKKLYGYHSSEELFVKIYLYYPQDVSRAANLLLGGAVLDKVLQPHESHIPFLLQFLVDYNLYGMGHVHLSKMKFRPPVPDVISSVKANYYGQHGQAMEDFTCTSTDFQADSSGDVCLNPPVWISSTVPAGWMWEFSGEYRSSHQRKRLSTCELEGDATIDEILNQQSKMYSSLSQTCSDVKMVQSLIPIWEEEYERTGMHEAVILPPDPSKPLPLNVLKTLSFGIDFESKLMDLCNEAENLVYLSPSEEDVKFMHSITTIEGNLVEHVNPNNKDGEPLTLSMERNNFGVSLGLSCQEDYRATNTEGKFVSPNVLLVDETQTSDPKAADKEAMGLLRWLVSSQAADDINSDEEVVREIILSPMLPAMTIDKVLEKANMDFESESQQECQDILDSVEHFVDFVGSKESASVNDKHKPQTSSEKMIPQVDGSGDDQCSTPCAGNLSGSLVDSDNRMPFQHQESQNEGTSLISKGCPNKSSQGSLPSSVHLVNDDELQPLSFNMADNCASDTELSKGANNMVQKRDGGCFDDPLNNADNDPAEPGILVGGSLRELMRRKRSYKGESSECETHRVKRVFIEDQWKADTFLSPKRLEFSSLENDGTDMKSFESFHLRPSLTQQTEFHALCDPKPTSSYSVYGKLPLLSRSENSLRADTLKDKHFDSCERVDDIVGIGVGVGSGNLSCRCSPQTHMEKEESLRVLNSKKHGCAVSMDHIEDYHNKQYDFRATSTKPAIHDVTSCKSDPSAGPSLLKVDIDAAGSDILSNCPVDQDMLARDGKSGKNTASVESVPQMLSGSLEGTDAVTNIAMQFENCGGGLERDIDLTGPGGVVSTVANMKDEAVDLIAMTFCKKPPMGEWANSYEGASEISLDESLPFFLGDSREEVEIQNKPAMGVPTHFQNDGSCLYMLTSACSPPSADSVHRWLLNEERGISSTNFAASMESSFLKGCRNSLLSVQGSLNDGCNTPEPNFASGSVEPIVDQLKTQNLGNQNEYMNFGNSKLAPLLQNEGNIVKAGTSSHCSQDISQISGPDGKPKPTPLSQVGFRDPASVGAGQQLTSISIEILAESRGDLRPDPRHDAINVIALVIEDDNNPTPVVYVLLRSIETYQRNIDGISGCRVLVSSEERQLLGHFMKIICLFDPDILLGWDIQGGSLGFLAERASFLGIGLLNNISRTPSETEIATRYLENTEKEVPANVLSDSVIADPVEDAIIDDEWGRTHASGVHVGGRIVLNIWRLMRGEIKLNLYTVEAVAEAVLKRKIPSIRCKVLTKWFLSGPGQARYRSIEYVLDRAKLNLEIINQLDMINRTSELARVFGIDFFSVLSRGSQYRVESMLLRLAHTQNYIAISPGNQQVASQPAMECLPLVMEPESGFYADPVVVLDFQSLYPSMLIAYNLCFCTCLGKVSPSKASTLGVSSFSPDPHVLRDLKNQILITPNGVMYAPSKVRKGILPRLLEEILSTRIMVKQSMKKLSPSQKVLQRIFNARQLALKLIANVTYGYTAAGFSGRMPCAELADSIVQCGRLTLETAISFVNAHDKWKARVIYGDTDSMFVLLKGRTVKEAFRIGQEIASEITAMNPVPVTLKFEKVYHPCFLLTKKRYVGYSYESPDQLEPVFDAKGIETVRRDTCGAVAKTMEQSLRLFFEHQDIFEIKAYLQRQWTRILSGRVSLQDFVFAKEVCLGSYSTRTSSSLPPAAIVATKAMKVDPRAEPRYGERIPYVVIHGEPGARLVDMVVDPLDLLAIESPFRLNDLYYINKQIIPALQRVFGLVQADLNKWFLEMPRSVREALGKRHYYAPNPHRTRIDYYYLSKHCLLCGELVQASAQFCNKCSENKTALTTAVVGRTSKLEREMQHLAAICRHCGGGDWLIQSGVKCTSLACSVFYERRKVQKELQGLSAVATEAGFYPKCTVEWF